MNRKYAVTWDDVFKVMRPYGDADSTSRFLGSRPTVGPPWGLSRGSETVHPHP